MKFPRDKIGAMETFPRHQLQCHISHLHVSNPPTNKASPDSELRPVACWEIIPDQWTLIQSSDRCVLYRKPLSEGNLLTLVLPRIVSVTTCWMEGFSWLLLLLRDDDTGFSRLYIGFILDCHWNINNHLYL